MTKSAEFAGIARVGARFVRSGKEEIITEVEEVIGIAKFESTPAMVTRGYGLTLNLGNYESARFDVSITMPCYPEDVDACDKWAAAWAEERVQQEMSSVRGGKKKEKEKPAGAF